MSTTLTEATLIAALNAAEITAWSNGRSVTCSARTEGFCRIVVSSAGRLTIEERRLDNTEICGRVQAVLDTLQPALAPVAPRPSTWAHHHRKSTESVVKRAAGVTWAMQFCDCGATRLVRRGADATFGNWNTKSVALAA